MQVKFLPVVQPRSCGPCTLCCKVLIIPELNKPAGVWCKDAQAKKGCGIYATRPAMCQEFECAWLQGGLKDEHRPDKIHGVAFPSVSGTHVVIAEDPGYPGVARRALDGYINQVIRDGQHYVLTICGDSKTFDGHKTSIPLVEKDYPNDEAPAIVPAPPVVDDVDGNPG